MAEEKKVMDVAKPGSAKPDTGSKPMVIGHRSMVADPAIKTDTLTAEEDATEKKPAPAKKIRLKPISESIKVNSGTEDDTKPDESTADIKTLESEPETSSEPAENPADAVKPDEPAQETNPAVDPAAKDPKEENSKEENQEDKDATKKEKQEKVDTEQVEREERLQQLIKSKEYNVQIKQSHNFGIKTFLVTFLIVLVLGVIGLAALADAELLDLGIDLPFDYL